LILRLFRVEARALIKFIMATINKLSDTLAQGIAEELEIELEKVCPVRTGELKGSISIVKDGNDYVIQMRDYWKYVEYLSNPFVRFTLNTKMPDILNKVTKNIR